MLHNQWSNRGLTIIRYVLDEYCAARRQLLVRSFVDALTVGGPGGTPRPIELHAHDPSRYIGDMLAWLHQGRTPPTMTFLTWPNNELSKVTTPSALGSVKLGFTPVS